MTGHDVRVGLLHHVELWVPDLAAAQPRWQWLLHALGYEQLQLWDRGVSYRLGPTYIVLEQSPALIDGGHERRGPASTIWPSTRDPAARWTGWLTGPVSTAGS